MRQARGKKLWGEREDLRPMLEKVCKTFPESLRHIKPDRIFLCGFICRHSKHLAKIRSNKTPWSLLLPDYDYCIEFHTTKFDRHTKYEQRVVMFHELYHIPQNGFVPGHPEYRKTKDHDVEDFSPFIRLYGIHLEHAKRIKKGEEAFLEHLAG